MSKNPKTVIVGLDGVPFDMLKTLAQDGIMPNTQRLISQGTFRAMRSSIPEISSVAWSSIITGANPAEHGIFGFMDLRSDSYKMKFPNFNDIKAQPFWDSCPGQAIIMNVPSTYPVREMNGVHISGFVSLDFEKSVYPPSLVPELRKLDYQLDVDALKAHTDMNAFLKDLDGSLDARIRAYRYLWDEYEWQVFMLVFTGTDRLMHFLFDAYEDADHQHHDFFLDHFRKIDAAIGEIAEKIAEDDLLIMLSDHGFERLDKDVYVNHLLASEGFLTFEPSSEPKLANISSATKAFALDPGRVYINQHGKYPAGNVPEQDKDACLKYLEELFGALEIDGKKVIKHIYRKQDIYAGPYLDQAADMILLAEKGFNLKGSMASEVLAGKGPFTGKHTYPDAFLLANNKDAFDNVPDQPCVVDVGKFIKTRLSNS